MIKPGEREAASFLASQLIAANIVEFLDGVARTLAEHDRDVLTTTEAIRQISWLLGSLTSSNGKLRSLVPDGGSPPGGAGDLFLPWKLI